MIMARGVKYRPNPPGVRYFGEQDPIGKACADKAEQIAEWARADDPDGRYEVDQLSVPSGWRQENRSGAIVTETVRGRGPEHRTLVRALQRGWR
jgi:hypothetical protein